MSQEGGIDHAQATHEVFFKLYTHRIDRESWVTDKAMVDRLDKAMKETGLLKNLSRRLLHEESPNSSRHYVATYLKVNDGWSWEEIALHLGHSKEETEMRYAKAPQQ